MEPGSSCSGNRDALGAPIRCHVRRPGWTFLPIKPEDKLFASDPGASEPAPDLIRGCDRGAKLRLMPSSWYVLLCRSAKVVSGCRVLGTFCFAGRPRSCRVGPVSARMRWSAVASSRRFWKPWGLAAKVPVVRYRCRSFSTNETQTPKSSVIARQVVWPCWQAVMIFCADQSPPCCPRERAFVILDGLEQVVTYPGLPNRVSAYEHCHRFCRLSRVISYERPSNLEHNRRWKNQRPFDCWIILPLSVTRAVPTFDTACLTSS